jgi:hypothetical protein
VPVASNLSSVEDQRWLLHSVLVLVQAVGHVSDEIRVAVRSWRDSDFLIRGISNEVHSRRLGRGREEGEGTSMEEWERDSAARMEP